MPFLPIDITFHTNWWNKNCGISFTRDFFYDPDVRVGEQRRMLRYLYERFGDIGLGVKNPEPAPVIGPTLLGTGYLVQEILGCDIIYQESGNPMVVCADLSSDEVMNLKAPDDIEKVPAMRKVISLMNTLEEEYGYVVGDIPMHSPVNVSIDLRGQQYFTDLLENEELVEHLHSVISETIWKLGQYIKRRTGSVSISLIRIVGSIHPDIMIIPNCNNQMISPELYKKYLLKHDRMIGEKLSPLGIHHCGNNAHLFAGYYAEAGAKSLDVGVGSDIKMCRKAFPDGWLYLRMDPVKMLGSTAEITASDTEALLVEHGEPFDKLALNCSNIDFGTPDECIRAMFEVAENYRGKKENVVLKSYLRV